MKKFAMVAAAILVLIGTAALVVSLGLVAEKDSPTTPVPATSEQHPPAPSAIEGVYVLPDDGAAPLIEELDAARSSISIEIYLLTDDDVLAALFHARDRGVTVRVLLEKDPYGGSNQQPQVFDTLTEGDIQVRWNTAAQRFSHVKLIVIDRRVALVINLESHLFGAHKKPRAGRHNHRPRPCGSRLSDFRERLAKQGGRNPWSPHPQSRHQPDRHHRSHPERPIDTRHLRRGHHRPGIRSACQGGDRSRGAGAHHDDAILWKICR